jgi:hypothetical protein
MLDMPGEKNSKIIAPAMVLPARRSFLMAFGVIGWAPSMRRGGRGHEPAGGSQSMTREKYVLTPRGQGERLCRSLRPIAR